jgi:hypothetical protein
VNSSAVSLASCATLSQNLFWGTLTLAPNASAVKTLTSLIQEKSPAFVCVLQGCKRELHIR